MRLPAPTGANYAPRPQLRIGELIWPSVLRPRSSGVESQLVSHKHINAEWAHVSTHAAWQVSMTNSASKWSSKLPFPAIPLPNSLPCHWRLRRPTSTAWPACGWQRKYHAKLPWQRPLAMRRSLPARVKGKWHSRTLKGFRRHVGSDSPRIMQRIPAHTPNFQGKLPCLLPTALFRDHCKGAKITFGRRAVHFLHSQRL